MEELRVKIFGRVEGVFYRTALEKAARALELTGYVKREQANEVEVVAQGDRQKLEEFLRWCQRGSSISRVDGMTFNYQKPAKKYDSFQIIHNEALLGEKIQSLKNLGKRAFGKKDLAAVPNHVVIIPDGNRRWARTQGWHPWVGHVKAIASNNIMELALEARELGIKYITFWAFSTENWSRDPQEVTAIFNLFRKFYKKLSKSCDKYRIKFKHLGRKDRLPEDVVDLLEKLEEQTKGNTNIYFQLALDYGGKDEIFRAFQKITPESVKDVEINDFNSYLDTAGEIPDPDLIIRTSGEKRSSGVLMWQSDYAEFYFTDVLFPDFNKEQLRLAVLDYSYRVRRFGGTSQKDIKNIDPKALTTPEDKELLKYLT